MPSKAIDELAEYCSGLTAQAVPPEIHGLARWKILDSLACAYLGEESPVVSVTRSMLAGKPSGSATAIFGSAPVPVEDAVFANSAAIHSLLQDDVDLAIGHPACNVIPAAVAVGELVDADGPDIIAAIVAGYEAMWRIGGRSAWMIPTITRGFRGNTILGVFGAAAAASRVMRLDGEQTANALATAASFAAGLLAPLNAGTMERSFQQAHNAQAGVTAAFLAANGTEAHRGVLAGQGGFYSTFSGLDGPPEDAMANLGESFYITESFSKPYPSAGSNTVGIAVLDRLLSTHGVRGPDISTMRVEVVPRFTGRPGYPMITSTGPFRTFEETLISFPFGLACLAILGSVTGRSLAQALERADVTEFARRIELVGVDVPYPLWCRITARTTDDRTVVMTSDDIEWSRFFLDEAASTAKFSAAAGATAMTAERVNDVVDLVRAFDTGGSARALAALLRPVETMSGGHN